MRNLRAICFVAIIRNVLFTETAVIVLNADHWPINEIEDKEAGFGPALPAIHITGHVVQANPVDGCTPLAPPPDTNISELPWIVIIRRKPCRFVTKVLSAQEAGYIAAIVYDDKSDDLIIMTGGKNASLVTIPSVFIGNMDGEYLIRNFNHNVHYSVLLEGSRASHHLLMFFTVAIGVFALLLIASLAVSYALKVYRRQKSRLSKRSLKKIPVTKFKEGDVYDTCAICLEDYVIKDRLRVLPCSHVFHLPCIDPWLTKNKCTCPICKRNVFPQSQRASSESDDDDESSENSPLLSAVTNDNQSSYSGNDVTTNTLQADVEQGVSVVSASDVYFPPEDSPTSTDLPSTSPSSHQAMPAIEPNPL